MEGDVRQGALGVDCGLGEGGGGLGGDGDGEGAGPAEAFGVDPFVFVCGWEVLVGGWVREGKGRGEGERGRG